MLRITLAATLALDDECCPNPRYPGSPFLTGGGRIITNPSFLRAERLPFWEPEALHNVDGLGLHETPM